MMEGLFRRAPSQLTLFDFSAATTTVKGQTEQDGVTDTNITVTKQVEGTTTLQDSEAVRTETIVPHPFEMLMFHPSGSIEEFLERSLPRLHFTWSSTHVQGSLLTNFSLPGQYLNNSEVKYKLHQFNYIRGDIKLGFRVNGNKFHYGKLMVTYLPGYESRPYNTTLEYQNIISHSSLPWVMIDPSDNETVEMIIPFINSYDFVNLHLPNEDANKLGMVFVWVLNPLRSLNETTDVTLTLFMNWVNPVVTGQTAASMPSWSSGPLILDQDVRKPPFGPTPAPSSAEASQMEWSMTWAGRNNGENEYHAEMDTSMGQAAALGGAAFASRLGSNAADGVSSMVTRFASRYGSTVMGNASSLAKTGRITHSGETTAVVNKGFNFAQSRGKTNVQAIGCDPEPFVKPYYEVMGSHPQETDLNYLMSIPSLLTTISWDNTRAAGDDLMVIPICPQTQLTETVTSGSRHFPTMLAYVTRPFRYWRGAIRLYFQIVASPFHSGRLQISYELGSNTTNNCLQAAHRLNRVIDIQQNAEFAVEIPYMDNNPFYPLYGYAATVFVKVLNKLAHPVQGTATDNAVYINCWISAGPDMMVGYPTPIGIKRVVDLDFYPSAAQASVMTVKEGKDRPKPPPKPQLRPVDLSRNVVVNEFKAEGLTRKEMMDAPYEPIGTSMTFIDDHCCFPDHINSVYDLVGRHQYWAYVPVTNDEVTVIVSNHAWWHDSTTGLVGTTFLDWFNSLYLFVRGGVDYKVAGEMDERMGAFTPNTLIASQEPWADTNRDYRLFVALHDDQAEAFAHGAIAVAKPVSNVLEVFVPYNLPWRYKQISETTGRHMLDNSLTLLGHNFGAIVFKAAGPDFVYGFVGPPPTFINA